MPLVECPDCRNSVSKEAAVCPHCGYPLAEVLYDASGAERDLRAERRVQRHLQSGPGRGCALIALLILGSVFIPIVFVISQSSKEKRPTCQSSWQLCTDNAELVNNNLDMVLAQSACEMEAKTLAKYGTPKFDTVPFGSFYMGDSYVKMGVATLVEKNAQFSNAFGAMVHTRVICRYDLNSRVVIDARVEAN